MYTTFIIPHNNFTIDSITITPGCEQIVEIPDQSVPLKVYSGGNNLILDYAHDNKPKVKIKFRTASKGDNLVGNYQMVGPAYHMGTWHYLIVDKDWQEGE